MKKINKKISSYNHSSRSGRKIEYIVIHWVGAVSTAKNNGTYFANGNRNASAHYFVDDTSIWQSVEDKNSAWHCGGGLQGSGGHTYYKKCMNSNSLGIEMCCKRKDGRLYVTDKTIKNTAELVKYLQKKYGITDARVIRHYDVTGKSCPAPFLTAASWSKLHKTLTGAAKTGSQNAPAKLKAPIWTVKRGSTGQQVKRLQQCLNKIMGTELAVDGSFGPATDKVFRQFQRDYGLVVDGSCGPKSRAKIKALL